jgi:NADPH:quinone reductase-like Zn-dependent oxidoreductase
MKTAKIVFTDVGKAELLEFEMNPVGENEILIETEYTAISAGTERAVLMRMPNLADDLDGGTFPKIIGYSGAGYVKEIGSDIKSVKPGDRVITMWGQHSQYNILPESNVIKIDRENLPMEQAVFLLIGTFSAAGVRKTRLEFGESAMIFGAGILGAFAVQLCRAAGQFRSSRRIYRKNAENLRLSWELTMLSTLQMTISPIK